MSSSHIIIVARNMETGAVEFPLGDMTLYGTGLERELLEKCCHEYDGQWVLSLYAPTGDQFYGDKRP